MINRFSIFVLVVLPLAGLASCSSTIDTYRTMMPVSSDESRAQSAGWRGGGTWMDQHEDINRIGVTRPVDLVFLGDSITQSWGGEGRNVWAPAAATWAKFYADRRAANFGISGDRTQHVLWRIDHGNFDRVEPRVIVVLIGTNNMGDDTPEAIAAGVEAIVHRLEDAVPGATILLLGVLPRGERPDDPMRVKVARTNTLLRPLGERSRVRFRDIGERFLHANGLANAALLRDDFLHLDPPGYRAWAEAIEADLRELTATR